MPRKLKRYVVGYGGARTVYGRDQQKGHFDWIDTMTLLHAQWKIGHLAEPEDGIIYELVPVKLPRKGKGA